MLTEIPDFQLAIEFNSNWTAPLAYETTPGLVVHRLRPEMEPNNPRRWRIAHRPSGRALADAMTRQDAIRGAEAIADFTDWTQDVGTLQATADRQELWTRLYGAQCDTPRADYMPGDVSSNGTYTDDDIRTAAAAFADLNALELCTAMAHSVPWMGLDTEEFNEAQGRIAELTHAA